MVIEKRIRSRYRGRDGYQGREGDRGMVKCHRLDIREIREIRDIRDIIVNNF